MLRPGSFALTLLLSLLTGLGPLSMDMYLPSLPAIGRALQASTARAQFTISSYLFGFPAGQIVYGPIADRFGRRPVILAALVLYGIGSVFCAATQSIETLIAPRFVPSTQIVEDAFDSDAQTPDDRFAVADIRIDGDPIDCHSNRARSRCEVELV